MNALEAIEQAATMVYGSVTKTDQVSRMLMMAVREAAIFDSYTRMRGIFTPVNGIIQMARNVVNVQNVGIPDQYGKYRLMSTDAAIRRVEANPDECNTKMVYSNNMPAAYIDVDAAIVISAMNNDPMVTWYGYEIPASPNGEWRYDEKLNRIELAIGGYDTELPVLVEYEVSPDALIDLIPDNRQNYLVYLTAALLTTNVPGRSSYYRQLAQQSLDNIKLRRIKPLDLVGAIRQGSSGGT